MDKMKVIVGILIVIVLASGIGTVSAFSNSGDGDWKYYKEITVKENSGKTLTNYQVLVELNPSNFPANAKSDGSDLRFEDASGKELSYWIEDWNYPNNANIWVKVPSIPANREANIKMYYGNPSASAVSDGDKVFEFFDDFEGNSLDTSKWFGTASVSNSEVSISGGNDILTLDTYGIGYAIRAKAKVTETSADNGAEVSFGDTVPFGDTDKDNCVYISHYNNPSYLNFDADSRVRVSSSTTSSQFTIARDSAYHIWNIKRASSSSNKYTLDNEDKEITTNIPTIDLAGALCTYSRGGGAIKIVSDWFLVRKYASTEPTFNFSQEYPTTAPTPAPPTAPAGKIKAVWLYNLYKYDTATLMTDLKSAGINTIFLSTDVNNIWKYERFVKSAHENDINVHAMVLEDPRCALKENHASSIKAVETVLDYNDKSLAKFDGINIDTEPYVDLDLEQVWQDYITLLETIHEKTAGKTVLSADIPRWYDEGKIKDLAPNVDFFVIMAYDSGGVGWNTASEIEDAVASEMGAIRGEGSNAVIGIGVHEGFRDKDAVEKCIEDLYNYYSDDPAFLGVSIFKYESYSEGGFKHITIGELVEKLKKDPESVVGKKFATKGLVLVSTHEGYKGISTLWKILRITSLIGSAGIADIGEIPPEWLAADFMAIISNSAQDQDFCDMHKAFPYIEAYATNEELWAKSGSVINMEGEIEEKKILWHTFYVFKIENIESNSGYNNLRGLLKSNEKDKVKIMCVVDKNLNGMGLYDFIHIQTQQSVNVPYQALVEIEGVIKDIKTVEENGKEQYEYYIKANKVETLLTVKEPPTRTAQTQTIAIQCPVNATITDQYNRIISDDGTNEIPNARMIITSKIKIFYLPADLRYSTEIEAYDTGTFNFTRVSPVEDDISITKFENVPVTKNTKALVEIEQNVPDYTMSIDYDGDETIDEEKEPVKEIIDVAPEIPTPTPEPPGFEAVFAIVGLLVVAYVWGRRKK